MGRAFPVATLGSNRILPESDEYPVNPARDAGKGFAFAAGLTISAENGETMRATPLILLALLALTLPAPAPAQDASGATIAMADDAPSEIVEEVIDPLAPRDAAGLTLAEFQWIARPIVVFADTPADPRFIEQMELLTERGDALLERDVVIIVDTDPAARSDIRTALRPRGFSIVVVAKDGTVGMRRPAPRDVREIIRAIDNFQLRQEEIRRGG